MFCHENFKDKPTVKLYFFVKWYELRDRNTHKFKEDLDHGSWIASSCTSITSFATPILKLILSLYPLVNNIKK